MSVKTLLAAGAAVVGLGVILRVGVRALRRFIVHLWPH